MAIKVILLVEYYITIIFVRMWPLRVVLILSSNSTKKLVNFSEQFLMDFVEKFKDI